MGDYRKREKRSFPPFSVSHCPLRAFLSRLLGFPVKQRALNISTTNSIWEIKWCSPFRLRRYRKYELLFETIHFFWSVQSLQLIWLQFVASFFHKVKFDRLMFIKRDSLLMFMHKIFNRIFCINVKHPKVSL